MNLKRDAAMLIIGVSVGLMVTACKREDTVLTHPITTESLSDHVLGPSPELTGLLDEARATLAEARRSGRGAEVSVPVEETTDLVLEIDQRLLAMEKVRDASGLVKAVDARRRLMAQSDASEREAREARRSGDRNASAYWSAYVRSAGAGADRIDFVDRNGRVVRSETTEKGRVKESAAGYAANADSAYARAAAYDERADALARAARSVTGTDLEHAKTFLGTQSDIINERLRPALIAALGRLRAATPSLSPAK